MESNQNFTAVFERVDGGFIAYIEEIPGVNTQGDTIEEARANLSEAYEMIMAVRREIAEGELVGKKVIKEPFRIVA
jgi:predicted RNase H-like HicB family nuclease